MTVVVERCLRATARPTARSRFGLCPTVQNTATQVREKTRSSAMARRLIEAGVRLVSVTAWCGTPPGERFRNVQTWDMHGAGAGLGSISPVRSAANYR